MRAMIYEVILRRIYHCERFGVPGADAREFTKMEVAYSRYKKYADGNIDRDLYCNLNAETIRIASFLSQAITSFAIEYDDKISYENKRELALLKASLSCPDYEIVCKSIDLLSNILVEMNVTL